MNILNNLQGPELFDLSTDVGRQRFSDLLKNQPGVILVDTLGEQKQELSIVENPTIISHKLLHEENKTPTTPNEGVWAFFSWRGVAVRILQQPDYEKLRLSRNLNLITQSEQDILKKSTVAIAGLNVGNPGAICMALEGISDNFKLADFDGLSVSNLNRFRGSLIDLGVNKADISARQIWEINPYAKIDIFGEGISVDNVDQFLNQPKIDVLVEEMDNLKLKILIREKAKSLGIPVVMVTGNGENVLIDIERYDQDKELPILAGYIKKSVLDGISALKPGEGTFRERVDLARDFMGSEYLDPRLVSSFSEVGITLAGIPQLAESSFLRGAAIAHFVKNILLNKDVPSGRYEVKLSGQIIKHD